MRILVVEDDKGASRFIKKGLEEKGFAVDVAYDGQEGLYLATSQVYDVMILDIMLPELDGFELLKCIRRKGVSTPVIFLTAKGEKVDIVHGLEIGADDYLVKPFAFAELLARIAALIRRVGGQLQTAKTAVGDLTLNLVERTAVRQGNVIELSNKEFALLEYFVQNVGQVLTRTMILEHVWGYDFDTSSNVIDVHINRLRAKVDKDFGVTLIKTIKGVGYAIKVEE